MKSSRCITCMYYSSWHPFLRLTFHVHAFFSVPSIEFRIVYTSALMLRYIFFLAKKNVLPIIRLPLSHQFVPLSNLSIPDTTIWLFRISFVSNSSYIFSPFRISKGQKKMLATNFHHIVSLSLATNSLDTLLWVYVVFYSSNLYMI